MERYTNEQRILIVKLFYQNGESFAATVRKLRSIWGYNNAPKESTVKRLMEKFAETGSVADVKTTTRLRTGRTTENIAAVRDDVAQTPFISVRQLAQQIGVSKSTMQRILKNDLHLQGRAFDVKEENLDNYETAEDKIKTAAPEKKTQQRKRKAEDVHKVEEPATAPKKTSKTKTKADKKVTVDSAGVPEDPGAKLTPVLTEAETNGNTKSTSNRERAAPKEGTKGSKKVIKAPSPEEEALEDDVPPEEEFNPEEDNEEQILTPAPEPETKVK